MKVAAIFYIVLPSDALNLVIKQKFGGLVIEN